MAPRVTRIATVGGRPISIERLEERVAEVRRGPRGRHLPPGDGPDSIRLQRWIAQELVNEEVLAHEARAAGIAGTEVAALVDRVTASITVPIHEVRAYYDRNRDRYRRPESRRVRHILLADEASAQRVTARLDAGDEMAVIAATASTDPGSRAVGGDLGDVHRGEFSGAFEEAIFAAEVGAIVGPIRTEHGWHVARVEAVTVATVVPFAEARSSIEAELLIAARMRAFETWLDGRRATLAVIAPEYEHPGHPIHGLPSHRH